MAVLALAVLLPAQPASAASCSLIPQVPWKSEIGNTNTYLIHWATYVSCTTTIASSTATGTLTRNGTPYDVMVDEKSGVGTGQTWLVLHEKLTACPPATAATYRSSIGAAVVLGNGQVVNLPAQARSALINCALF